MRLLACGGRDYLDSAQVFRTLDRLRFVGDVRVLIHGAARGADALAARWAARRGVPAWGFAAAWDDLTAPGALIRYRRDGRPYNARAGLARNAAMLAEGRPSLVVAFPGGTGTAHMRRLALAAGVEVLDGG